jgi:hypothetical protein
MRQTVSLEAAAEGHEWVFALLTLDVVRAFYDMMGLDPAFHAGLHGALRDATVLTRKELVRAPVEGGPKPALTSFCRHVEGLAGEAATEHLAWWLQHVSESSAEAHRALRRWMHVMRDCQREEDASWRQLAFPQALSTEASMRFVRSVDPREFARRRDALEGRPLSDWDLHMYASKTYDFDEDREGTGATPLTHVALTVRAYQQYQFWAWALRALTPDEQTRLRDSALAVARALELTSVNDLVHPSALDIGL